jgi:hypothetical protein
MGHKTDGRRYKVADDKFGKRIKVGDLVTLRGKVIAVHGPNCEVLVEGSATDHLFQADKLIVVETVKKKKI